MKKFVKLVLLLFTLSMVLSSCKMLKGDPRKNCNHPDHGKYMMEKRRKKMGKY
ncbi:MAG: hypothetical protein AAGI38_04705 [Bacteroidota bacterium]